MADDLADALRTQFAVSNEPHSTSSEHPRFGQYKNRGKTDESQEKRRREALDRQKRYTRLCLYGDDIVTVLDSTMLIIFES